MKRPETPPGGRPSSVEYWVRVYEEVRIYFRITPYQERVDHPRDPYTVSELGKASCLECS